MIVALLAKPVFKNKYGNSWLICEEPKEARDNGYHFFKYMSINHQDQKCYYAIKNKSVDAKKVQEIGETINYGSIQHWLAYFLCEYNISSQKGGKPNAALCAFFEMNGIFKPQNVFLQHGIIINNVRWLYADRSNFKYFITSTVKETKYIEENFGYPVGTIQMTGLPRFDALHDNDTIPNRILIMPTWRYWFNLKSKQSKDTDRSFSNSEYFKKWSEIINSREINDLIVKYDLEVIFYPHRNMQNHIDEFRSNNTKVKMASWINFDIQELLKTSAMLVTDYSSVFFDMVYMKKPVVFFQFDEEKYRRYQYGNGYFDYHTTVFGDYCQTAVEVVKSIEKYTRSEFMVSDAYLEEHKALFEKYDKKNSQRIYELLLNK